ncbi:MAG: hypothetical protein RR293_00725 [Bacteroidales bacterium]
MKKAAEIVSYILSPVMMPFYGFITIIYCTYLSALPLSFIVLILGIILVFTALIPSISLIWLHQIGAISNIDNPHKEERVRPYLFSLMGYIICIYFLIRMSFPIWMISLLIGGIVILIFMLIINKWWKISAHMTGIGAYIGLIYMLGKLRFILPIESLAAIIISAGLLGTCRIYLGRHTLGQVLVGAILGFLWCCASFYVGILL